MSGTRQFYIETTKALGLCACGLAAMLKLSAAQFPASSCTSPWLRRDLAQETRSMVLTRWRHSPHPAWVDGQLHRKATAQSDRMSSGHMIGRQSLRSRRRFTSGFSEVAVHLNAAAALGECQVTAVGNEQLEPAGRRCAEPPVTVAPPGYRRGVRAMPPMKTSSTASAIPSTSRVATPQRGKWPSMFIRAKP
jgi:hypothetical protein